MPKKLSSISQLTRFAMMGIPQDAVCPVDVTNQCNRQLPGLVEDGVVGRQQQSEREVYSGTES